MSSSTTRLMPLFVLLAAIMVSSFAGAASFGSAERARAIEEIAARIEESYVFEDVAKRLAAGLRARAAAHAYDRIGNPESFAEALTRELREESGDTHIEVVVATPEAAPVQAAVPVDDWRVRLRRRNFDFASVEILPGNVGYLRLDSCPPPELAGSTAAAAMAFLAHTDAVIVDLRANEGGDGAMVQLLASYFVAERTPLIRVVRRPADQTTTDTALPHLPGPRVLTAKLYFLTSSRTHSAAEAFAFALQQLGRAKVVGERTRGGANPGRYRQATEMFRVFVPVGHAISPATNKSWERVGVQPDIAADERRARSVAYREVLRALIADAPRKEDRERLTGILRAVRVE